MVFRFFHVRNAGAPIILDLRTYRYCHSLIGTSNLRFRGIFGRKSDPDEDWEDLTGRPASDFVDNATFLVTELKGTSMERQVLRKITKMGQGFHPDSIFAKDGFTHIVMAAPVGDLLNQVVLLGIKNRKIVKVGPPVPPSP